MPDQGRIIDVDRRVHLDDPELHALAVTQQALDAIEAEIAALIEHGDHTAIDRLVSWAFDQWGVDLRTFRPTDDEGQDVAAERPFRARWDNPDCDGVACDRKATWQVYINPEGARVRLCDRCRGAVEADDG